MGERSSNNDVSGHVEGHLVQVGAVHGDLVLHAEAHARVEHARRLCAERLDACGNFLAAARELGKAVHTPVARAIEMVESKQLSPVDIATLGRMADELSDPFTYLSELCDQVRRLGPEAAAEATQSVYRGLLVLWYFARVVDSSKQGPKGRRWLREVERTQEGMTLRFWALMDEIRKVRETPPL